MISNKILLICLAFIALTACSAGSKKQTNHHMENEKRTLVKLETTMGNITVALYNETPKHRDNFIKLVKEGVYDSTLFHRVIKQFMIQAGDPDSKNAHRILPCWAAVMWVTPFPLSSIRNSSTRKEYWRQHARVMM